MNKVIYTELYDNGQSTVIHTDPKQVPEITSCDVEAALRDMKNGPAIGSNSNRYWLQETLSSRTHLLSCTLNAYQEENNHSVGECKDGDNLSTMKHL